MCAVCVADVLVFLAFLLAAIALALAAVWWHRTVRGRRAVGGATGVAHGARSRRITSAASSTGVTALEWEAGPCYPMPLIAESVKAVRGIKAFGLPAAEVATRLAAIAARLRKKYDVPFGIEQLEGLRRMEVALVARFSGEKAQRYGREITSDRAAGLSVLEISARRQIAPLAVLRQLLFEGGRSEAQIARLVAAPAHLPPDLAAEAPAIFEADPGSSLNGMRTKARAQAFEDAVGAALRAQGAVFQTEEELRSTDEFRAAEARRLTAEAAQEPARGEMHEGRAPNPVLTPDFLFTAPTTINGHRVTWLDAKNYMAYDSKLVLKSTVKQAKKYVEHFGPGAFVFSGGVLCPPGGRLAEQIGPSVLLLDGSKLRGVAS
jgi:hypothetical protein